jgi:hypothetical protein
MTRSWLLLAVVSVALASAIWLVPASIHIVSWPPAGPVRVALLAPLSRLWWVLGSTCVVMGSVAALARLRSGEDALGAFARAVAPLALLLVWVVPFLPWLPDRAPLLLALTGPLRWVIAAGAAAGTLASSGVLLGWSRSGPRARRPRWGIGWAPGLPGRATIFAISLALYLFFGFLSAAAIGPGADEPHYLIITHSLLVDHDLAIENNHTRGDYRAFFGGELRPDFLQRGRHEVIYSVHAPGLPALLLPAYAVAGYRGALAMICLIAALTALAVFDLAEAVGGRGAAWLTWLSVCATVPFLPHAWLIFPEMPGALIAAWAALWLWRPLPQRPATWRWRGLALAALPWLHTKFVVLLACLTAFLLVRLAARGERHDGLRWPRVKLAIALVSPIAVSVLLWLYSFYLMYGVFDPEAPYGGYTRLYVLNANIPRSLLGLLFDQKFGLLVYSPVYALAAAGCWLMLWRIELRWFATALALSAVALVISNARLYMWWGGSSAPARFLVPILPLLAPMIAVAIRDLRGVVGRAALAACLFVSLAVAFAGVAVPGRLLLFSEPHGSSRLVETVQNGSPLASALPTFTDENWRAPIALLLPWAVAGFVSLIVVRMLGRRLVPVATFWTATLGVATFGAAGSLAAGRTGASDRAGIIARGQLSLMAAYDGSRLWGFDYSSLTRLNQQQLIGVSAFLVPREPNAPVQDPHQLQGPFELPPGRYESRVWFDGGRARTGEAFLTSRNQLVLSRTRGPLTNPAVMSLDLPVPAVLWVGLSTEEAARAVRRIDIVPQYLVPRSERPAMDIHAMELIVNPPGAYIVYADANTYPEGGIFWTRDTHRGDVFVAPAGAVTLLLTLYQGPVSGPVSLNVGGQHLEVNLSREETRQIEVPVPGGMTLVPVSVQSSGMFRPADVDPRSGDVRWLGCQVRIDLR